MPELTMLPNGRENEELFSFTDFASKYNITDDISSLSDEAIEAYIDDLHEEFDKNMNYINLIIGDILSDIVLLECFKNDRNHCEHLDYYVSDKLCVKYASAYNTIPIKHGVKFDSDEERYEYLHKAVKLVDTEKVESIALDYINFKFHTFCYTRYNFMVQPIKDMIHKKCTEDLIFRIFDDPYMNVYRQYIYDMGFNTHV